MTLPAWAALPQPGRVLLTGGAPWRPAPGNRVVAEDASLHREAGRLADELRAGGHLGPGASAAVVVAGERDPAAPGDVVLRVGDPGPPGAGGGAEAYRVDVGGEDAGVVVTGRGPAGVHRGTRQVLHNLAARGAVPAGTVSGAPAVAERVVHLDAARVPFEAAWIEDLLREAAWSGLTAVQLHLSEDQGFRVASVRHPEVVSPGALTHDEVRHLLAVADDLHLTVIPSLVAPGHLGHVLAAHPHLALRGADGTPVRDPGGDPRSRALDVTDPDAVALVLDLVDEVATLFAAGRAPDHGTPWNIGADEFVDLADLAAQPVLAAEAARRFGPGATGFDVLVDVVHRIAERVRAHGFRPQVWNDGMFRAERVALEPDVRVAWWTGWSPRMAPLSAALDAGHDLLNAYDSLLYYVLGEHAGYRYPTAARLWETGWHPGVFADRRDEAGAHMQVLAPPYPAALRGTMLAIWGDVPDAQTPEQVAAGVRGPLRGMSERAWNAGSRLDLSEMTALDHAVGRAPAAAPPTGTKG
ncbi:family 20 glycosylhydrolase [Cellulomonas triticagri]|uniref:Beta-N-acetylglucosaminidase n=1 Tax=Cellulomonas triticagri TaxID=2483352 RepID=A0A3M2JPR2_9CELL|nr:family 20 glycosylhydrolase [Cellulomonas triticagri]RMI12715.1 beta-N-acetylglucosaminidase [Cellulomonas triticagri]